MEIAEEKANMRTDGSESYVKILKTRYRFSEMEFQAYRRNGNDYFFNRNFEGGLVVVAQEGKPAEILSFDMPQGVYERISISLKVRKMTAETGNEVTENKKNSIPQVMPFNPESGLIMEGFYTNTHSEQIPLIFAYNFDEVFEYSADPGNKEGTIAVSKSSNNEASIRFNPSYWMQLINSRMLQSAKLTLVNGTPTIIISEDSNEHIFNLLTSRIKNASKLNFIN